MIITYYFFADGNGSTGLVTGGTSAAGLVSAFLPNGHHASVRHVILINVAKSVILTIFAFRIFVLL